MGEEERRKEKERKGGGVTCFLAFLPVTSLPLHSSLFRSSLFVLPFSFAPGLSLPSCSSWSLLFPSVSLLFIISAICSSFFISLFGFSAVFSSRSLIRCHLLLGCSSVFAAYLRHPLFLPSCLPPFSSTLRLVPRPIKILSV